MSERVKTILLFMYTTRVLFIYKMENNIPSYRHVSWINSERESKKKKKRFKQEKQYYNDKKKIDQRQT